jgi:subtilisin family serine protease
MKHTFRALALALVLLALLPAAASAAPASSTVVAGELIVRLRPGFSLAPGAAAFGAGAGSLNARLAAVGASSAEPIGGDSYLLRLPGGADVARAAQVLAASPVVRYAEPNHRRQAFRQPNDDILSQQWALRNVQAFEAWDITTGGPLVIAIVDTGVSASHPDLASKLVGGYNAFSGGDDAGDNEGHGTAMAGVAAAESDNGSGIAGMCWDCRIMPVKVLDERGGGDDALIARGIRWAVDNGARIINLSLGGPDDTQTIREVIQYAHDRGALVIASSGNGQAEGNRTNYPAAYETVVAVSATGNSDVVTGFSTTGPQVDIAAPGVGIWSTQWFPGQGDTYAPENGTSPAAPYVAGAAGLIWSLRPDLSADAVACVLEASADDKGAPGKDSEYGWGRLNALRALQLAQGYTSCPLSQPAPAPANPAPAPANPQEAFAPVPPVATGPDLAYFPETGHTLRGEFKRYWQAQGGLPIFGYPISEEFSEAGDDGQLYTVQYFERHRLEFHPENAPPYNVQLARIGDVILKAQGRDWFAFPRGAASPGCVFFQETGHSVCGGFLSYWRANGLEFDRRAGKSMAESLALFGQPLSEPQAEEIAPGVTVTVQWFERARFEDHGGVVLLGLLGNELARVQGRR